MLDPRCRRLQGRPHGPYIPRLCGGRPTDARKHRLSRRSFRYPILFVFFFSMFWRCDAFLLRTCTWTIMTVPSRTLRETRGRRGVGVARARYRRARGVRTMGRGMIRRTILMEVTGRSPSDSRVCLLNSHVRMRQFTTSSLSTRHWHLSIFHHSRQSSRLRFGRHVALVHTRRIANWDVYPFHVGLYGFSVQSTRVFDQWVE